MLRVSRSGRPIRLRGRSGAVSTRIGRKADARTRTGDPFITSEVLYQLSYVGNRPTVAGLRLGERAPRAPYFATFVIGALSTT